MNKYRDLLFSYQDKEYQKFTANLNPTYDINDIIGVRFPDIRRLGKEHYKDSDVDEFLNDLPHRYMEENFLHLVIIGNFKDYDRVILELNKVLKYLKSWSETDTFTSNIVRKNTDKYINEIYKWLNDDGIYVKRFAVCQLMKYYLDDDFKEEYLELVGNIHVDNEYYLQMMIAWFFATAFCKQYDVTLKYFLNCNLDQFTYNKTISKCQDSFRITKEHKEYLKTLRK